MKEMAEIFQESWDDAPEEELVEEADGSEK